MADLESLYLDVLYLLMGFMLFYFRLFASENTDTDGYDGSGN